MSSGGCGQTLPYVLAMSSGGRSQTLPYVLAMSSGGRGQTLPYVLAMSSGGRGQTLPYVLAMSSGGRGQTLPYVWAMSSGGCGQTLCIGHVKWWAWPDLPYAATLCADWNSVFNDNILTHSLIQYNGLRCIAGVSYLFIDKGGCDW